MGLFCKLCRPTQLYYLFNEELSRKDNPLSFSNKGNHTLCNKLKWATTLMLSWIHERRTGRIEELCFRLSYTDGVNFCHIRYLYLCLSLSLSFCLSVCLSLSLLAFPYLRGYPLQLWPFFYSIISSSRYQCIIQQPYIAHFCRF